MVRGCDSCGFITKVKEFKDSLPEKKAYLCKICADTPAGSAFFYPANHLDNADALKMMAYIGNMILKAIKENKR